MPESLAWTSENQLISEGDINSTGQSRAKRNVPMKADIDALAKFGEQGFNGRFGAEALPGRKGPSKKLLSGISPLWHSCPAESTAAMDMSANSARRRHQRTGTRYARDLTDEKFAMIEPMLPKAERDGGTLNFACSKGSFGGAEGIFTRFAMARVS